MNKILKLIICILICQGAGIIGSLFTTPQISTWYSALEKPVFSPPNWLFAPVWTLLFLFMGVSLYLISEIKNNREAVLIFALQLILNVLWSVLFFGLQSPFYAFIEIIILWVVILFTIIYFHKLSKQAAYLLYPYILWVSFALILNYSIWVINQGY